MTAPINLTRCAWVLWGRWHTLLISRLLKNGQHLLKAYHRHCAGHFIHIVSFLSSQEHQEVGTTNFILFTNEESEAYGGRVTCLHSQSERVAEATRKLRKSHCPAVAEGKLKHVSLCDHFAALITWSVSLYLILRNPMD